jgi:hypothetical protein
LDDEAQTKFIASTNGYTLDDVPGFSDYSDDVTSIIALPLYKLKAETIEIQQR